MIDLGVRDPQRFRGWSGGNKARFTIAEADATPSYLPGPLPAGTWKLVLGVPNLRKAGEARYTARIFFQRGPAPTSFAEAPLKTGPGWYRGDLHMHTAHSDGSRAEKGVRVPARCSHTAGGRGAWSRLHRHHRPQPPLTTPARARPLLRRPPADPRARDATSRATPMFGVAGPDFQLGSPTRSVASIRRGLESHGVLSINHPTLPSGRGSAWAFG